MHQITLAYYLIGYRVRTAQEAPDFFRRGRVFAMLWAQSGSETLTRSASENSAITILRYAERIFTQVRRYVVIDVNRKRHFVYAWSDYDQSFKDCG
jgi:hypothetical protein